MVPANDLAQHARALHQVYDAVMGGSRPPAQPRPLVSRSWTRVLEAGLDPTRRNARDPAPVEELEHRRTTSRLTLVHSELQAVLAPVADASPFIVVISDADGVILWREGATGVLSRADSLGFEHGATWTEERVGTNAIGTAIAEQAPVQLFSAEHFELGQHAWYCSASPVHDPRTGELLGVVDVSGPALTLHPAIGALIQTATRLAEERLWHHHQLGLERLRAGAEHLLATVSDPLLLVDDDGWVAHRRGVGVRDRVAAPRAGRPLAVPGLGLCMPERVAGGWLIRRPGASVTMTAALGLDGVLAIAGMPDVTAPAPATSLLDAAAGWRVALSPRHAAVLRELHGAGPSGLTAGELSVKLFGDEHHQVTVRAEISRLRRTVGSVVSAAPYRINPGVAFTVEG